MNYRIICLEELHIPYIIKVKNVRRLTVKYNSESILVITQPLYIREVSVIKFIEDHLDWILKHKPCKPTPHDNYKDDDTYLLFGKEYKLKIAYSNHETVVKESDKIIIYTSSDKKIEKLLDSFRYEQAELVFNEMLYRCFLSVSDQILKYPKLEIKKAKSRWGCCYINEYKIMLNISLVHVPFDLIEYVIFHELIHFIHNNHSKEFHDTLSRYVKDEKYKRNRLKNYCITYK